jgi:hypothetical protein
MIFKRRRESERHLKILLDRVNETCILDFRNPRVKAANEYARSIKLINNETEIK